MVVFLMSFLVMGSSCMAFSQEIVVFCVPSGCCANKHYHICVRCGPAWNREISAFGTRSCIVATTEVKDGGPTEDLTTCSTPPSQSGTRGFPLHGLSARLQRQSLDIELAFEKPMLPSLEWMFKGLTTSSLPFGHPVKIDTTKQLQSRLDSPKH